MNILERVFNLSSYLRETHEDMRSIKFVKDPWTMDYIPELFVSSPTLKSQIANLVKKLSNGNVFVNIIGDIKSGKSFLMNLLNEGLEEILQEYSNYDKVEVLYFEETDFSKNYSLTALLQKIADRVMGKYMPSKEQAIVELKKYCEEHNLLLVILLDNFGSDMMKKLSLDCAKTIKILKEHIAFIAACTIQDMAKCMEGLEQAGCERVNFTLRLPELTLKQAFELVKKRLEYGLNQHNVRVEDIFTERSIESAWAGSSGNPWILISILSDAYNYARQHNKTKVTVEDVNVVSELFSRLSTQTFMEKSDRFIIQQAINNFPLRERQICEFLLQRDATAKELTMFLYGDLPPKDYRSKYMGTKSFLKRLKSKNVVVVKGKKGRMLLFGLNPKMKMQLLQPATNTNAEYMNTVVQTETQAK